MTAAKQREIVIEIEKVKTIRKRTRTHLVTCPGCSAETDSVTLIEAAKLFEISHDRLFEFIRQNHCHYYIAPDQDIYLCVPSLIERMHAHNNIRRIEAKREKL